ncbi:MAG: hypothetical protein CVU50_06195 [Candidatus Cloacimonetes bacterium HGW-Cloacimonetes-3]|jgi:ligand-binding sensor domain-containing protein|nr:MAG: hypothetical protein CVU50_06195 [Candidatus Cloacimonetes bacterium HGW-Cloacimonetes-3]
MKSTTIIMICLFFVLQAIQLFADPSQSMNYTNGMGVSCTAIDGENIWIGTEGGLVKMNRFTNEKTFFNALNSGLPDNHISCIVIDALGVKWIGTGFGVAKFDGQSWTAFNTTNSAIATDYISAIAIDEMGNKWIGGNECLIKFDGGTWTTYNTAATHLQNIMVTGIVIDSEGVKWMGTIPIRNEDIVSGLVSFNGESWSSYTTENSDIGGNFVSNLNMDATGKLWLCHSERTNANLEIIEGGLSCFDGINWTVYSSETSNLPNNNVNCITFSPSGIKWIGTSDGLASFDGTTWTVYNAPAAMFESNAIGNISIDEQGIKWLGNGNVLDDGGLIRFNGTEWSVISPSNSGIPANMVNCLTVDAANVKWMGIDEGLVSFDGFTWNTYTMVNSSIPYGSVNCMAFDAQGILWLGVGSNLVSYNGVTWNTEMEYFSDLTSIAIDSQNIKWIGVEDSYFGGLIRFYGGSMLIYNEENSGLPGRRVNQVACDAQGVLWVATSNDFEATGITKYDGSNWTNYNSTNSLLPGNNVHCIAIDAMGSKWIGTDNGMARLSGSTWTVYNSTNSALPNNCVTAIAIDALGDKWISSSSVSGWRSDLVRLSGTVFSAFYDAVPMGRTFNLISIDPLGNKWLASTDDNIGLIFYYEGFVHNEDDYNQMPTDRFMLASYPNPFCDATNITFTLDKTEPAEVHIYNLKGQLVKTLCNEVLNKGQQQLGWDGTDNRQRKTAEGVYLCRLTTSDGTSTRRLIRLK